MCCSNKPLDYRQIFLISSIFLTIFGCFIGTFSIGLVQWQFVEMNEFSSIHEHGIFWDCVSSEIIPLTIVRSSQLENNEYTSRWRRKCIYKFDDSAVRLLHSAIEAGDAAAREYLFHRFLPQHKAVVFFTVFTIIFAAMSIVIGGCSPCFIPNAVLHVICLLITISCSLFGDIFFLLASLRIDNRYIHGVVDVYQQKIGYAFYVHFSAAIVFFFAVICAIIAAYLLLRQDFLLNGCCNPKVESPKYQISQIIDDYPQMIYDSNVPRQPNGRPATVVDIPKSSPPQTRKFWRNKQNIDLKRIRIETEA